MTTETERCNACGAKVLLAIVSNGDVEALDAVPYSGLGLQTTDREKCAAEGHTVFLPHFMTCGAQPKEAGWLDRIL